MSDLLNKIVESNDRIFDIQKVLVEVEAVELATKTAIQAIKQAQKARSDAELVLARLEEKEKQIDDRLAELREGDAEYDVSLDS